MFNVFKLRTAMFIAGLVSILFFSCGGSGGDDDSIPTLNTPTNLVLTATINGVDASNPTGNGSGIVTFNFSADKGFSLKVKGPRAVPILFKLQAGADYNTNHEVGGNYTTPGVWQEILFDFTPFTSTNMSRIVIFFDITGAASVDPNDDKF